MSANPSDAEQIALSVLEMLEHARKRPGMYFAPLDCYAAENFLCGIGIGVMCTSGDQFRQINVFRQDVKRARGFQRSISFGEFESELRSRCRNEEHVIDELFQIETDAWSLMLKSLKSSTSSTTA